MIKYYVTNSFTRSGRGGNPAGVVYLGTERFKDEYMQRVAKELGFSETAFITDSDCDDYDYSVRFFTPTEEVDLCGHATLASFFILSRLKCMERNDKETIELKQNTKSGILRVELKYNKNILDYIIMEQDIPSFYDEPDDKRLSQIFGIDESDIGYDNLKPLICSTGLKDIIMPVNSIDKLRSMEIDFEDLTNYSNELGVVGVHAFTFIDKDNRIVECRNFAPAYGIDEESATGTSNGALGAYLVKNDVYQENNIDITCIQGVSMNKESEISVNVIARDNIEVMVGGKVTLIDEGYIKL